MRRSQAIPKVVLTDRRDYGTREALGDLRAARNVDPVVMSPAKRVIIRGLKVFLSTLLFNLTLVGIGSTIPTNNPVQALDVWARLVSAVALSFGPPLYSMILNFYLFVNRLDESSPEWMA
jgi:hypothetical protein